MTPIASVERMKEGSRIGGHYILGYQIVVDGSKDQPHGCHKGGSLWGGGFLHVPHVAFHQSVLHGQKIGKDEIVSRIPVAPAPGHIKDRLTTSGRNEFVETPRSHQTVVVTRPFPIPLAEAPRLALFLQGDPLVGFWVGHEKTLEASGGSIGFRFDARVVSRKRTTARVDRVDLIVVGPLGKGIY